MKIRIYRLTSLIFFLITACSQNSSQTILSQCPSKAQATLENRNVKPISLSNQTINESGIVNSNKSIGYSFEAKSGQKLSYKTNQDICIWIYTPDNQILNSGVLPMGGKYTIQISAIRGNTTFDLAMILENITEVSNSPFSTESTTSASKQSDINSTKTTASLPTKTPTYSASNSSSNTSQKPDADSFVRNHYIALNNRRYSETWSQLSPRFKNLSESYSAYQQWWNSVREIKIGNIKIIQQTSDTATVDVELWYLMNNLISCTSTYNPR
ncbi:hypothetical protein [Nostoc sphaeroides]|uniref:hypothetical protein n=1 Tax=Nostoc sphaeroides TaxID=446679 RepID=UPI001269F482|nr:hypothetical protein [Nostoc sphaeroides]